CRHCHKVHRRRAGIVEATCLSCLRVRCGTPIGYCNTCPGHACSRTACLEPHRTSSRVSGSANVVDGCKKQACRWRSRNLAETSRNDEMKSVDRVSGCANGTCFQDTLEAFKDSRCRPRQDSPAWVAISRNGTDGVGRKGTS